MTVSLFDFFAVVLPPAISVIVKPHWSNAQKLLTALSLCLVLAGVEVVFDFYVTGTCNLEALPHIIKKTILLTMTSYAVFWRPFGVAQKIEEKVNT